MLEDFENVSSLMRAGVYVLRYGGTVVYVGQSTNMLVRVYSHRHTAKKKAVPKRRFANGMRFDEVLVKPCLISDLDRIERELIEHFKPRYNMRHKPLMSFEQAQEYLASGIVAQIIAGTHERPQASTPSRPLIDRRGF